VEMRKQEREMTDGRRIANDNWSGERRRFRFPEFRIDWFKILSNKVAMTFEKAEKLSNEMETLIYKCSKK
jgi:hypothetical protein